MWSVLLSGPFVEKNENKMNTNVGLDRCQKFRRIVVV